MTKRAVRKQASNPKRSASSKRWLARQNCDTFVRSSGHDGFRARSAYKLMAIDDKVHALHKHNSIIDLGAAPGSWSQVARKRNQSQNVSIVACDILDMQPIDGVCFVRGDFISEETQANIFHALVHPSRHLVLSDLAPNMTGVQAADQASAMFLAEQVFAFAHVCHASSLLIKLFMGAGVDAFVKICKQHFAVTKHFRPDACRKESREFYLYATNLAS